MLFFALVFLVTFDRILSELNPRIIGGFMGDIIEFPYSAALLVYCVNITPYGNVTKSWNCGASIISERFLLTAAHCLVCPSKARVMISVGSTNRLKVKKIEAKDYKIHEEYTSDEHVRNDIGVILLKDPLVYNSRVSRVVLTPDPPLNEPATVAGWGYTCEEKRQCSETLIYTEQYVLNQSFCQAQLTRPLYKTFCAGLLSTVRYPAGGDSGSALVVRKSIQIGLVSYRQANRKRLVVYTDTSRYFNWIWSSVKELICKDDSSYSNEEPETLIAVHSKITKHPYTASLTIKCIETSSKRDITSISTCGATILNRRMLVTAANCLVCRRKADVMVTVGNEHRNQGQTIKAKTYIIHEKYKTSTMANNLAVILLTKSLIFSDRVDSVRLTRKANYDDPVEVVGFGFLNNINENKQFWLMAAKQKLLNNNYCQNIIHLPSNSLCASMLDENAEPDPGDSGNPLVASRTLIGIVSHKTRKVIVYTDIIRYYNWIMNTVKKLNYMI